MSATHDASPPAPPPPTACAPDRHHLMLVTQRSWRRGLRRKVHIICWACGLDVEEP